MTETVATVPVPVGRPTSDLFLANGAKLSDTAATIPDGLDYDQWAQLGPPIEQAAHSSQWWLGDWVVYGDKHFGERDYTAAIAATGLDVDTVRVAAWVAAAFTPDRRRQHVPFAHHQEVANLDHDLADQLLDRAQVEGLTRVELRRAVKQTKALTSRSKDDDQPTTVKIHLVLEGIDKGLLRQAAEKGKIALESWLAGQGCQATVSIKP